MPPRIPGASLLWTLTAAAAEQGRTVFLLGGRPGAGSNAMAALRQAYPGLQVDVHCPPLGFEADTAASEAIRIALHNAASYIVFCAFGFPKQERLRHNKHSGTRPGRHEGRKVPWHRAIVV